MEEYTWENIRKILLNVLKKVELNLDADSIDAVRHYIDHDEYEMAFEGLFIEIMKLKIKPDLNFNTIKEVGMTLKLNEESVFDYNFWNKFEKYTAAMLQ